MKMIVLGGDERFVCLAKALEKDGHGVFPMAMEKALPVAGPPDYLGTEAVILPLPGEKEGRLNSPLSEGNHALLPILENFPEGTKVFAGMAGENLAQFCRERGLELYDYYKREDFQIKNALLTAEGALGLMLGLDGLALSGRRAVLVGFGRIARLLAPRLSAMGMSVLVLARKAEQRALAEAMGFEASGMGSLDGGADFIINTVPAPVIGVELLERAEKAHLIELASAPGGFIMEDVENLGRKIVKASALPDKWARVSAAEAIKDTIYNMLEE